METLESLLKFKIKLFRFEHVETNRSVKFDPLKLDDVIKKDFDPSARHCDGGHQGPDDD